jgi:hypothetical protein
MHTPPSVATTPLVRRRRAVGPVVIAAAVVIGVSILRPWGDAPPAPPRPTNVPPTFAAAPVAELATPLPAPSLAPDQIACSSAAWQLVSLDHLGSWTVRSWIPARAVQADGPLDPGIRLVTMDSPKVVAIGACSPATTSDGGGNLPGGPVQLVRAWHIDAGRARPVSLAIHREERLQGVATLYTLGGTVRGTGGDAAAWPAGEFVVEIAPVGLVGGAPSPVDATPSPGRAAPAWFIGLIVHAHE